MAIVPDTKNWTWVLERECPECGFDSSATPAHLVPGLLRANAAAWPAVLERSDVTERPDAETWSALEYAAHVRDVFRIFAVRLQLMLEQDEPRFANWDQDETAVAERYNEQDPATVSAELTAAAEVMASALEAVPADAWDRTGFRGDGSTFTVDTLTRYFIHDPVHHLHDVRG
ncbi:DinB family protein [Herbiconiux liangxiaofengii]|uniref:DinB family protein n=1 Tax=Herbiconiux liangxiaofengii TaxID=3342795 RepID=UPI0035B7880E